MKALFERAMLEATGAELAYYDVGDVVGRLRQGPVRSGDIYNLESWQNVVRVAEVEGASLPAALVEDLRRRGPDPDRRRVYRVASAVGDELGSLSSSADGPMLRDATIAYVKAHGLATGEQRASGQRPPAAVRGTSSARGPGALAAGAVGLIPGACARVAYEGPVRLRRRKTDTSVRVG